MVGDAATNFGFLSGYDARFVRLGEQAERYFADDPHGTLVKLRLLAEFLTREAAARLGVAARVGETQADLLARLHRTNPDSCPADVIGLFHGVRTVGNAAVHGMEGGHGEALTALKVARQLAIWFHRTFGRDPAFKPGPFRPPRPPPDPSAPLAAEIERLRAERDAASSEAERRRAAAEDEAASRRVAEDRAAAAERERAEWEGLAASLEADRAAIEARLAGLLQAATAAPAAERRAVAQAAQAAARTIELDEAATRDLIDVQLRARGWEADTRRLRFAAGTRPERGRTLAIAEWPTETGPADYALFAGTLCVGVVEAKRRNRNAFDGLKQAERYARGFALHGPAALAPGAPWADGEAAHRVPFAFSANGRPYLQQLETASGIWFRDLRRPTNPARALADWHTPADLLAMLQQDVAAAETALAAEPIAFGFPLYPHQTRAIQAVEAALAGGQRAMLVAMATGTGKTKLSIALLYRLLAAGRFRRVCFVVDRTALGEQAEDEFRITRVMGARTFADSFGLVGMDRADVDPETRVHVTTIQGLVSRVLGGGDPAEKPAPGQYDLLVVDECHRGYLLDREMSNTDLVFRDQEDYQSQYRRALEYFDAVKIGLTATPALHTVSIFGRPVFEYGYREAVVDGCLVDHEPPIAIETQLAREGIRYRRGDALTLFHPDTGELDLTTAPDDLGFDVDGFNRRVITRPFNAAVCGELARHLDPGGQEKTLIFAATDGHADLVVDELRKAFRALHGEVEDAAIQKITGSVDKPGDLIRAFRNDANPRIAVTVDLLTTGVDVRRITGLVFLRRVGSRILFDQMLGRATRLCPEIGKETFRIFDAVGAYDALRDLTAMKPVAADPRLTFAALLADLARASDPAHLAALRDQLLAKLRARLRRLGPEARAAWEHAAGEAPEQTCARLASGDPAALPAWAERLPPDAGAILDAPAAGGPAPVPVSDHPDRVVEVRPVFGPDRLAPEEYLTAFRRFVAENANRITGLHVVTTRPRELTRAQLREIKLALDGAGFREAELHAAWRAARSEDMAAGIVAHIRQAALGDPLRPWAARVEEATGRLLARGAWTAPQRDWLRRIGKRVAEMDAGTADPALLDEGQFKADGGFRRLNRIFDGRLIDVLGDLNEEVWRRTG